MNADDNYCPVHKIKCQEIKDSTDGIKELRRSKLSIRMFQIFVTIALSIVGTIWYQANEQAKRTLQIAMEHQAKNTEILEKHVKVSNRILKLMSRDVREIKLNQNKIIKTLDLEPIKIPDYYGDD